ncbi:MAG TPA: GNAT family N-acetyltransferase [Herpetosiphonaceae bacterium]
MPLTIRPFADSDYEPFVDLHNAAAPSGAITVAEQRDQDANPNPQLLSARWVAERDGALVGACAYGQSADLYHPRKFIVSVWVDPPSQRHGLGGALYAHLCAQLAPLEPVALQARAYEDDAPTLRFLARRGFAEDFRVWESRLDVARSDLATLPGLERQLAAQGVRILAYEELAGDPRRDEQLYALDCALLADVLSPVESAPLPFERYVRRILHNPQVRPYFVAVKDGEYIGLSYARPNAASQGLDIEMTGVRREWRRRGLATALKLRGIEYACRHGLSNVRTWNDTINQPILALNQALGFVHQPALIFFETANVGGEPAAP